MKAPQAAPLLTSRLISSESELVRLTRDLAIECRDVHPDLEHGVV